MIGVNLLLGSACDMDCPYCLQTSIHAPANHPANVEDFAEQFVRRLHGVRVRRFVFWGGEPMLYLDKIKALTAAFTKLNFNPEEGFFITTNGRRMTEDYVRYANKLRCFTVISSHDWSFSDKHYKLFFQLKSFSFAAIIHHRHLTFWDLRDRFYKLTQTYGRRPIIYLHHLRATPGCAPEFYLTEKDIEIFIRHITEDIVPLAAAGDAWALGVLYNMLSERSKELRKKGGAKCVRADRLTVDLHGNIYGCHHSMDAENIIGNLFRPIIPIIPSSRANPNRYAESDDCRHCEALDECHGGCYLSVTHDMDCLLAKSLHQIYPLIDQVCRDLAIQGIVP